MTTSSWYINFSLSPILWYEFSVLSVLVFLVFGLKQTLEVMMPLTASLVPAGLSLSGNTWHDPVYAVTCCCHAKVTAHWPREYFFFFFLVETYGVLWTAEKYSKRHKPVSYYRLHAWNMQAISTYGVNQHSSADFGAAASITTCYKPAPVWRDDCVWRVDWEKNLPFFLTALHFMNRINGPWVEVK